jgi:hypothetical protein
MLSMPKHPYYVSNHLLTRQKCSDMLSMTFFFSYALAQLRHYHLL